MTHTEINPESVYVPSEDIVARDIEGELIIVPLTAGVGDMEDEIYTLNKTGRAIWDRLDGEKTLIKIAEDLATQFEASVNEIRKDVIGLTEELLKRRILVEVKK